MLKNGYFTDFTDDGNDVWSFKHKNNVIIKSPKNGDLFKVGDVLKVEIYTNNVTYATLTIGKYKELKNSIENKNIVTFSDYIFTNDNIGNLDIEVKVGDSIYLDTASSTVQVLVEASGDATITKDWLKLYDIQTVSVNGSHVITNNNKAAKKYDWAAPEELNGSGVLKNQIPATARKVITDAGAVPSLKLTSNNLYTDFEGRYWVAVGPNVMNISHKPEDSVTDTEMQYGTKIDIHVQDKNGKDYFIPAVVGDLKNHTYPDGLYQTGVDFDTHTLAPDNVDGSSVEFMGWDIIENNNISTVNITNDYLLVDIIVYTGVLNYR